MFRAFPSSPAPVADVPLFTGPTRISGMGNSGTYMLFRDAPGCWCALPPMFRNAMLDPMGCGKTPQAAIADLLGQPAFREHVDMESWRLPLLSDFIHVRRLGAAQCCTDCAGALREPWPGLRTGFI